MSSTATPDVGSVWSDEPDDGRLVLVLSADDLRYHPICGFVILDLDRGSTAWFSRTCFDQDGPTRLVV